MRVEIQIRVKRVISSEDEPLLITAEHSAVIDMIKALVNDGALSTSDLVDMVISQLNNFDKETQARELPLFKFDELHNQYIKGLI